MATKRKIELNSMSVEDLSTQISELGKQLSQLKFDHAVRGLANPKQLASSKKEIARLKTEVRSRELANMPSEVIAKRDRIVLRRKLAK